MIAVLFRILVIFSVCKVICGISKSIWIDFDETISFNDTMTHVFELLDKKSPAWETWNKAAATYYELYVINREKGLSDTFFDNCCQPSRILGNTIMGNAIYEIEKAICQRNVAETTLYYLINEPGLLVGYTPQQLFYHGMHVPGLHPHVRDTLQAFMKAQFDLHVLSLHCSEIYIMGALNAHQVDFSKMKIHGNNFAIGCDMRTTGPIDLRFINGIDKLRFFELFTKQNQNVETVFIGDSLHDFPSMVFADLGIWVETKEEQENLYIRKIMERSKVQILDLPTGSCPEKKDIKKPRVYRTRNWQTIKEVILACSLRVM